MFTHSVGLLLVAPALLLAQSTGATGTVAGAGYAAPAPISVAPGQIVTIFAAGVGQSLTKPVQAPAGTLPTTLAGISVTVHQISDKPAPLLEVRPVSTCPGGIIAGQGTCATLAAITFQVPYEVMPLCPQCLTPAIAYFPTTLSVSENGTAGTLISVNPYADQIHILTSCDVFLQAPDYSPSPNYTGLPCQPEVTHNDGSLVTADHPAKIGEALTVWAVGLGQTDPPATTGELVRTPSATSQTFGIDVRFTPNALAVRPSSNRLGSAPVVPLFAGLAPGFVGLYQINFVVPAQDNQGTPHCSTGSSFPFPGFTDQIQSNLTVSIGGTYSFDGAGICVDTLLPVD
jgi:uncharacterized protein (TIGR03437 family)